jgi:hypothetical protein
VCLGIGSHYQFVIFLILPLQQYSVIEKPFNTIAVHNAQTHQIHLVYNFFNTFLNFMWAMTPFFLWDDQ